MRISHKLLLSHTIIIAFILMVTVAYQKVTTNVGKEFVTLGNRSIETVSLLKDLRFSGLRIISSTGEYLLIGSLENQRKSKIELEGGSEPSAAREAGHKEEREEVHNDPEAAAKHVASATARYGESLRQYEQHISENFPKNLAFSVEVRKSGEALIAKSTALRKMAKEEFDPREILEQKEEFEHLEEKLHEPTGQQVLRLKFSAIKYER